MRIPVVSSSSSHPLQDENSPVRTTPLADEVLGDLEVGEAATGLSASTGLDRGTGRDSGDTTTEQEGAVDGSNDNDNDDDDDDVTVIVLDHTDRTSREQDFVTWIEQSGPDMVRRRRALLLQELRRMQRTSFLHFALLCIIPAVLLMVMIGTVVGGSNVCVADGATLCQLEPRTFINAFTTRCVCDAIPIQRVN
jgi:hypothetical protein